MTISIKSPICYDISHWKEVPDFDAIVPRPLLVITKATEGVSYVDRTFGDYFTGMRRAGYARGVFHFFRKAYDPLKQAQHFVSVIAQYIIPDDILVLDFEEGGETAAQIISFLQFVQSRFPQNIIMNYSRKNLMDAMPMTYDQRKILTGYPTWIAGYPNNPDTFPTVPAAYIPDQLKWGPCWLWQYTSSGAVEGISGDVDLNWIHPTFYKLISGHEEQPPIDLPGDIMDRYRATWDTGCNRRVNPNINNTPVLPFILNGKEFDITGYFVPDGKTAEQEIWGLGTDNYWVALTYGSQVRAVPVIPPPVEPAEITPPSRVLLEYPGGVTKVYVPE